MPALDRRLEVAVGGRDEAHVDRLGRVAAERAGTRRSSSDAQQLGLQRERQLADLVEEERAAVRGLERPGLRVRARR